MVPMDFSDDAKICYGILVKEADLPWGGDAIFDDMEEWWCGGVLRFRPSREAKEAKGARFWRKYLQEKEAFLEKHPIHVRQINAGGGYDHLSDTGKHSGRRWRTPNGIQSNDVSKTGCLALEYGLDRILQEAKYQIQRGATMVPVINQELTVNYLSEKIFLDRYALKGDSSKIVLGDTVVVTFDTRREIGTILDIQDGKVDVLLRDNETATVPLSAIDLPLETKPEQMWLRVASAIASVEPEHNRTNCEALFNWLLQDWRFVPGGRILNSAGAPGELTAYNCYVLPSPHDSRGGIMETLTQMTEIMARGGGVGINLSSLRPNRAMVKGINGRSSGSVSWGGLFSYVTGLIEQGGSRRGALMLILDDWHPDLMEFINAKREMGKITNANISVGISDKFMEAVKQDDDWGFYFPDTAHPRYDDLWDGDLVSWSKKGRATIPYGQMKARDIWNTITESAHASAEPGIWFKERSEKLGNSWYYTNLVSTNPCVTGDTRVFSGKGLVKIEDLVSQETDVVVDGRFGYSDHGWAFRVMQTGVKEVYELATKEGYKVKATTDHKIMTPLGWMALQDLKPGDKIRILNREGCFGSQGSLNEGRVLGWFVGDGHFNSYDNRAKLDFYHEKRTLAKPFVRYVNDIVAPMTANDTNYQVGITTVKDRKLDTISSVRLGRYAVNSGLGYDVEEKNIVPESVFQGTREMQQGFLQALFSADGTVRGNIEKGGSVRLSSSYPMLLEGVQLLLANFGIASKIHWNRREAGYRMMPDGNDGEKPYWCKASHELIVSKWNLVTFSEKIGFLLEFKQQILLDYISNCKRGPYKEHFNVTVSSITALGKQPVYDLVEPLTRSFIANGIVVHNCGEQPLPGHAVCNLGAINLAHPDLTKDGRIDWDLLSKTVKTAVRFLDNVIDQTHYFSPEIELQQKGERRIGLGVMGLGEMFIRLKVRYGDEESVLITDDLFKHIARKAYEASIKLAQEKGPFPKYDQEKYPKGQFVMQMLQEFPGLRPLLENQGSRNVTVTTVAPTGSTATMIGTSTGIEPFYAWEFTRSGRLGTEVEHVGIYEEWFQSSPRGELPDYFVTAMDLTPEEHIMVQAAAQNWVDSAISKTCNVPHDYTVDQVRELYELMYELGCKGGTVYRDGSRDEQVLATVVKEDDSLPVANGNVPTYRERPLSLRGNTWRGDSPVGTVHTTVNDDDDGPFEVFLQVSKAGSDVAADAEGLGRLISFILRIDNPGHPAIRLEYIMNQLANLGGGNGVGFGPSRVESLPDAVAQALGHYLGYGDRDTGLRLPEKSPTETQSTQGDICPQCGQATFVRQDGCQSCISCGYSRC